MDLRKQVELIEVAYEDDNQKVVLTHLDVENGEVLEVNFNRRSWDDGKLVDDPEKAAKVDEWCKEYFDLPFNKLTKAIGRKMDVYVYDKFNSYWEADVISKFDVADEGKIIQTKIAEVLDDGIAIKIRFENDGKTYESRMNYSKYVENLKKWFTDPQKKETQYQKFEEKFGVPVKDAAKIVGKDIMVEVKVAFKKFAYAEIKKPSNWK